ncbi:MAG: helix-turn-helix domain-containing protein [Desulfobaccales bacterium]|jgi:hypothetical protein
MQLFTPQETARFLKVSLADLEALIKAEKIGFVEVAGEPRFRCDHIVRFIRENTRQAQSEWLPERK